MVSKSKFLAVVLSSLVLVSGSRALAADPCVCTWERPGALPVTKVAPKKVKAVRQRATTKGKKSVCIQDQAPVSTKSKSPRKSVSIQDQAPVSTKTPTKQVSVPDVPTLTNVKNSKSKPPRKIGSIQAQDPVSAKSKPARKGGCLQTQELVLPKTKTTTDCEQTLPLPK